MLYVVQWHCGLGLFRHLRSKAEEEEELTVWVWSITCSDANVTCYWVVYCRVTWPKGYFSVNGSFKEQKLNNPFLPSAFFPGVVSTKPWQHIALAKCNSAFVQTGWTTIECVLTHKWQKHCSRIVTDFIRTLNQNILTTGVLLLRLHLWFNNK